MTPEQKLQEHIYKTYFALRSGLCWIAFVFPIVLFGIGWWNQIHLQNSMSAYYFAFDPQDSPLRVFPGRVVFVGVLFVLGISLMLYKGFSRAENWLLNIAGLAAVIAALFPMQPPDYCTNCGINKFFFVHEVAGVVVFGCLALVAWFCTGKTLVKLRTDSQRRWFRGIYIVIGILMVLSPLAAIVMTTFFGIYDKKLFFIESFALWTFAAYWAVRSYELHLSQAEWSALTGKG
jgi:hypothetical protein